jgi:predicted peroxiredoxin
MQTSTLQEVPMGSYLLVESRDPFEAADVPYYYDLAADLARKGHVVTLFLVQNGVLPVRAGSRSDLVSRLAGVGVQVLADDFSLRERGIAPNRLAKGVEVAPLERVIDLLGEGRKALWH